MQFLSIDVETANADMASICQVGTALFSDGVIVKEWETYVDPQDHFDGINISIHGIDESRVQGAPTFSAIASELANQLNGRIVVAHTAFDRLAIYQAGRRCQMAPASCSWLDSACVARRAWTEFSRSGYGLKNVCESIGYAFRHHDALEDAKAAGYIILAAIARTGLDLDAWLVRVRQPIDPSLKAPIAREGNPDGELFGEVLVFTGALTIARREAADLSAIVGCEVDASVTARTTLLVVGDQDIRKLAGHEKSSKHRKVEELARKGQHIRILQETDFRELVALAA